MSLNIILLLSIMVNFSSESDILCKGCYTICSDETNSHTKELAMRFETCHNFADIGFHVHTVDFSGCHFYGAVCVKWFHHTDCKGHEVYWSCFWHEDDKNDFKAIYHRSSVSRSILMRLL